MQSLHVTAIVFGVSIISVFTTPTPKDTPPPPHIESGSCGLVSETGVASVASVGGK